METLKKEAMDAISKLPESADADDIMYRIYVIDKINKEDKRLYCGRFKILCLKSIPRISCQIRSITELS